VAVAQLVPVFISVSGYIKSSVFTALAGKTCTNKQMSDDTFNDKL